MKNFSRKKKPAWKKIMQIFLILFLAFIIFRPDIMGRMVWQLEKDTCIIEVSVQQNDGKYRRCLVEPWEESFAELQDIVKKLIYTKKYHWGTSKPVSPLLMFDLYDEEGDWITEFNLYPHEDISVEGDDFNLSQKSNNALIDWADKVVAEVEEDEEKSVPGANVGSEILLSEGVDDFESLCQHSDTIVRTEYVTRKSSTDSQSIFYFELDGDFIGNVDEQLLHVYGDSRMSFEEGRIYYLFLDRGSSGLYPHVVYRHLASYAFTKDPDGAEIPDGAFCERYELGEEFRYLPYYIKNEIVKKGKYLKDEGTEE